MLAFFPPSLVATRYHLQSNGSNRCGEKFGEILVCFWMNFRVTLTPQFIRLATGGDVTVGHDLEPCTADIQIFKLHYPSRPDLDIVFVDTPGLDIDEEKIVDWLKAT